MTRHRLPRNLWPGSTRLKVIAWILTPISLVLILGWFSVSSILQNQVSDRIQIELLGDEKELKLLAAQRQEKAVTGEQISPQELVQEYLERSIPDKNEILFGVIDGRVDSRSIGTPPYRLDKNLEFVSEVSQIDSVTLGEFISPVGQVQYIAVPVLDANSDQRAVLVVAIFADEESADTEAALFNLALVLFAAFAFAALIGWFASGRVLAPVRRMRDTAVRITDSDLSERIPVREDGGGDDLDDLARTFNAMLDRIENAFISQREFVDDAGHELRTPLTIVRGNLEMLSLETDPAERESILALVSDEINRMSRIVTDLQLLTKAHAGSFLELGPVDAGDLVSELFEKARGLADRDWVIDSRDEGVIILDRFRITQAVMQLISNAIQHTQDGQEIALGVTCTENSCDFWVRDSGPGVPPAEREKIFERFYSSSNTDDGRHSGTGLGLSIVRAIANAHGGSVDVADSPSGGAIFHLKLPARDSGTMT